MTVFITVCHTSEGEGGDDHRFDLCVPLSEVREGGDHRFGHCVSH